MSTASSHTACSACSKSAAKVGPAPSQSEYKQRDWLRSTRAAHQGTGSVGTGGGLHEREEGKTRRKGVW